MIKWHSYAAQSRQARPSRRFSSSGATRAATTSQIEILYCGVCHSDLHRRATNGATPSIRGARPRDRRPRHRGRRARSRSSRSATSPASAAWWIPAGTGPLRGGLEQYCASGVDLHLQQPGQHVERLTYGGYSDGSWSTSASSLRVPGQLDLAGAAPLLCAGITTYSPLRHWKVGPGPEGRRRRPRRPGPHGRQVRPCDGRAVVLFTTSPSKAAEPCGWARTRCVVSKDADAMGSAPAASTSSSTPSPRQHDLNAYLDLLKLDGTLVLVGAPDAARSVAGAFNLMLPRRSIAGSRSAASPETQEMLDFCAEHGIVSRHRDDPASRRSTRPTSGC